MRASDDNDDWLSRRTDRSVTITKSEKFKRV